MIVNKVICGPYVMILERPKLKVYCLSNTHKIKFTPPPLPNI